MTDHNKKIEIIKTNITYIKDYPKAGVIFQDITSITENNESFALTIEVMQETLKGIECDKIAGIEARGFIFGAALAKIMNKGFVAIRKKNKLPREVISKTYALEYGTDTIEMHKDSIKPNERVIIIDDILATGGTMNAAIEIIREAKGIVDTVAVISEITELKGASLIAEKNVTTKSLIAT